MTDPVLAAAALARLTPICLALPEAGEMTFGVHRRFVVRDKTFAWFNDDHHGDGMTLLIKGGAGLRGDADQRRPRPLRSPRLPWPQGLGRPPI